MSSRRPISDTSTLWLWVAAGGRCEYRGCNRYLLADALTGYTLNLAERAHIVGGSDAPGSPRGDDSLPDQKRAEAANLMLLCRDHHRVIDHLIAEHGVEALRRMKREHEERIHLLTGLAQDAETVVVRMIGAIRGAPVEVPPESVLAAVIADGRFPRFPLALAGEDVEIDLRALPEEDDQRYWEAGERTIAAHAARIREAQQSIGHMSIFALARIPFLVALGFHLDDKIPVTVYSRRRDGTGDGAWGFDPDADAIGFEVTRRSGSSGAVHVALAVSVTAAIGEEVIAHAGEDAAVYELSPVNAPHGRDLLGGRDSLANFAGAYHRYLAHVEAEHPDCKTIDLYAAVPATGAVHLGRGLMRDAQPRLRVHERSSDGQFCEALSLG
jgi:hypothetical protein